MDIYKEYFPWEEYRPQQKTAIEKISLAVSEKKNIMFRAPCGFGKSVTTISAALSNDKKIILITPNHSTRSASAKEVLSINQNRNKKYKIVDLRAKKDMCHKFPGESFSYEKCDYARKYEKDCEYYDNLYPEDAHNLSENGKDMLEKIQYEQTKKIKRFLTDKGNCNLFETCSGYCKESSLCYYYLMNRQIKNVDVIILDYFWVTTGIFNQLNKMIPDLSEYVLLIDEADMFIDRINEGNTLSISQINNLIKNIEKRKGKITDIDKIPEKALVLLNKLKDNYPALIERFDERDTIEIINFSKFIEEILFDITEFTQITTQVCNLIKDDENTLSVNGRPDRLFSKIYDLIEDDRTEGHILFRKKDKWGNEVFSLRPLLLRYAVLGNLKIEQLFDKFNNVVLFSATLNDKLINMHLGNIAFDFHEVSYENEDVSKVKNIIFTGVSSGFRKRTESKMIYLKLAKEISNIKKGILIGVPNTSLFDTYSALPNVKKLKEEKKNGSEIHSNHIYLLGVHQGESRGTNLVGGLSTAICAGYPMVPNDFHSDNIPNLYIKKQKEKLVQLYGQEDADSFMNVKVMGRVIQFIGRITRNIWQHKRLLILAEERFSKNSYLLPKYILDNTSEVLYLKDVIKQAKEFWN